MPFINVVMTSSKYEKDVYDSFTKTWLENNNSRAKSDQFLAYLRSSCYSGSCICARVLCKANKKCRCESREEVEKKKKQLKGAGEFRYLLRVVVY